MLYVMMHMVLAQTNALIVTMNYSSFQLFYTKQTETKLLNHNAKTMNTSPVVEVIV